MAPAPVKRQACLCGALFPRELEALPLAFVNYYRCGDCGLPFR